MLRRSQTTTRRPQGGAAVKANQTAAKAKAQKSKKKTPPKKKSAAADAAKDGSEPEDDEDAPSRDEEPRDEEGEPEDGAENTPSRDEEPRTNEEDFNKIFPPPKDGAEMTPSRDEEPHSEEEDFDKIFPPRVDDKATGAPPPNNALPTPPNDIPPPPPDDAPPPPPDDVLPPPPKDAPPPPPKDASPPPPNDAPPPPPKVTVTPPANDAPPPNSGTTTNPEGVPLGVPPTTTTTVTPEPANPNGVPLGVPSTTTTTVTPDPANPNGENPKTTVADPHRAPSTEAQMNFEGGSWRERRPDAPQQPGRELPPRVELSAAEKNVAQLKRTLNGDVKARYEEAIAEFEVSMLETAAKLAKEFDKTPLEVKKALRGKTSLFKERSHNLQNAKVWKFSLEENAGREVGNKLKAPALQKLLKERGLFEDLTPLEEDELLREFEELRGLKKSGTRLNNAAAARDVTAFTKSINRELALLNKRTGAIGFCAIARSDVNDTLKPVCVGTEDALKFFPQILQTTDKQFAVKFDNFGVNREVVGLGGTFDFLRKDTVARISDGLFRATGKHLHMKYGDYDDLLTDYGVELVGWPEGVPFQAPSVLGSMERLRPVAEHKEAVAKKLKKEKKERRDKGLTREEAKELKGKETKKKCKWADGDSTPRHVNRKEMDLEELAEHLRNLNHEKKRRSRARAAGKPIPAPSRLRVRSGPPPKKKSRAVVSDTSDDDDSDREEEEWVPVGGKARKSKRGEKRKAAEESESEEDREGEGGKKTAGRKKKAKRSHSDTSDEEETPPKLRGPLPFSARYSKKYDRAMALAEANTRRREKRKQAIRSSSSPQKSVGPKRPLPKPAFKAQEGTANGGGGTSGGGGGGEGTGGPRAAPTLTPGASTSRSTGPSNPDTSTNRPTITPGASTSQLPKGVSLAAIAAYQTDDDSSDED
ncbi:hypothetical protein C8F04DRAFT_1260187 [Mycena alexandri]|uniref:Uncharacterized protein n=1 Tax=Mycena alexandri TaxID=1745969 RepID=A0AAD6SYQ7_9AGAR|nr:hypothetical protein C8F04DRAFT_1260187 [Mycena alexandri]